MPAIQPGSPNEGIRETRWFPPSPGPERGDRPPMPCNDGRRILEHAAKQRVVTNTHRHPADPSVEINRRRFPSDGKISLQRRRDRSVGRWRLFPLRERKTTSLCSTSRIRSRSTAHSTIARTCRRHSRDSSSPSPVPSSRQHHEELALPSRHTRLRRAVQSARYVDGLSRRRQDDDSFWQGTDPAPVRVLWVHPSPRARHHQLTDLPNGRPATAWCDGHRNLFKNRFQYWSGITNDGNSFWYALNRNMQYNGAFDVTPFKGTNNPLLEGMGGGIGVSAGDEQYKLANRTSVL